MILRAKLNHLSSYTRIPMSFEHAVLIGENAQKTNFLTAATYHSQPTPSPIPSLPLTPFQPLSTPFSLNPPYQTSLSPPSTISLPPPHQSSSAPLATNPSAKSSYHPNPSSSQSLLTSFSKTIVTNRPLPHISSPTPMGNTINILNPSSAIETSIDPPLDTNTNPSINNSIMEPSSFTKLSFAQIPNTPQPLLLFL